MEELDAEFSYKLQTLGLKHFEDCSDPIETV